MFHAAHFHSAHCVLSDDSDTNVGDRLLPVNRVYDLSVVKVCEDAMRRAARVDAGQDQIVSALRALGCSVRVITQGDGIPDLLVGYVNPVSGNGYNILLEVKDGRKPPSARKLTPAEAKFFEEWRGGLLAVVNSVDEALDILKRCT